MWTSKKATAIEISNYRVTTGKAVAIAAINGLDLPLDSNGMVLPMTGDWTVEGRLVIDVNTFPWNTADYRMYAGANGSKISVIYEGEQYMLKAEAAE